MRRPLTEQEQTQRFRFAVAVMVRYRAKQVVKDQIRARGDKVHHYSAKDITELAENYVAQNLVPLTYQVAGEVAKWEEFAGYRCAKLISLVHQMPPELGVERVRNVLRNPTLPQAQAAQCEGNQT